MKQFVDDYRKSARCGVCKLPPGLCICAEVPRISLPVRVIIIRHPRERDSQSNSGHLVHRVFVNSEILDYRDVRRTRDAASLWDSGREHRVLFPQPGAQPISPETFPPGVKPALVVLDGKWRQARRMSYRLPGIRSFPFVKLRENPPSWVMRRPRLPGQMSTGEAVGQALELLGYKEEVREFMECLALLVARVLHVRGKFRREEVETFAELPRPNLHIPRM